MMDAYRSYLALSAIDSDCVEYVNAYAGTKAETTVVKTDVAQNETQTQNALTDIVIKGLKDKSYDETKKLLQTTDSMEIINEILIPALNTVGKAFESGKMFLPQLMMSAETVKNSFDAIKEEIKNSGKAQESKGKILLATVKGDIHDIGKNIVKVLLENYGYEIFDLGKDVSPEDIVLCMKENDIPVCGLSALMTTTVISMEETIKAIKNEGLKAQVWVGGAVLTQEYADMIGADKYCKDALAAVNAANEYFGS
jgi:5-methyltetrahydrofolate--homocysteine methyltransferase